ncbi:MAG TPA: hypothetical protein ENK44_14435 [Caldithrix abyssi]|uniref:Bacterial sugar transferase domain-containing protein n=1 Tax=Caldithrix abyssi TaxID=187145 RepID=A0A7V4UF84_CALAY|nr:hypothetical protein [Caldithrix abyssi]
MFSLLIFGAALIAALAVTWLARQIAIKYEIGSYPDERRVHTGFIPTLGGLGIYAGFLAGVILAVVLKPELRELLFPRYTGLFIAATLMVIAGLYDDWKGLNAAGKFLLQFIAVSVLIYCGWRIDVLVSPFGTPVSLGVFALPVTYLWLIGVSNAVNLLDGLDGLAAGVSVIVSVVFLFMAVQNGDTASIFILTALIAGLLGFLRYNYHPASIFMGDTGSLFLGLMLSALSIRIFEIQPGHIAFIVPLIALAIPIGDTSVAFFRRLNQGKHPFKPDKDHLHHRLIYLGLSHGQAVKIILFTALIYGVTAYFLARQSAFIGVLLLGLALAFSFYGLRRIGYLEAQRSKTYYGDSAIIKVRRGVAPLSMGRLIHKILLMLTDALMINLALYATWYIRFYAGWIPSQRQLPLESIFFSPAAFLITLGWLGLFVLNNLYGMRWDVSRFDQVRRISKVIVFGILVLIIVTADPDNLLSEGRTATLIFGVLLLALVNGGRLLIIWIEKKLSILEYAPHNTLLVGATEKGRKVLKDIRQNPHLLYNIVGYVLKNSEDKVFYGLKCLGSYEDIPEIVRRHNVEEVIIAINERSRDEILNIIAAAENLEVNFKLLPHIYDVVSGHKTEEVIGHPLIRLFPERMYLWQWVLKRLMDIGFSISGLLLLAPFFLAAQLGLWMSGIYPALRTVRVVGRYGKAFGMYNFETRAPAGRSQPFVARVLEMSRFYKFPALFNVLFGQMSVVGPRPETVDEVRYLSGKIKFYNRRFEIRPGFTGWAQVKYRYEEALKVKRDQFKQDLFYLENMSLTFDLRIILRSIVILLLKR